MSICLCIYLYICLQSYKFMPGKTVLPEAFGTGMVIIYYMHIYTYTYISIYVLLMKYPYSIYTYNSTSPWRTGRASSGPPWPRAYSPSTE